MKGAGQMLMRAQSPVLQRKQARGQSDFDSPTVADAIRSSGKPLDGKTRAFMESRFDHDFSRVRVHSDEQASQSAKDVNARAYTVGQDIVFRSGHYSPHTDSGRRLLAHELTHVVQQNKTGQSLQAQSSIKVGPANDAYEQQADQVADRVISSDPAHNVFQQQLPIIASPAVAQRGLFEWIDDLFGGTKFSETDLEKFLENLRAGKKVRSVSSDNRARAIVKLWKTGNKKFDLTAADKIKLIKEMLSGFTGDNDEQAIIDLLKFSKNDDLRIIFGPGGVNINDLNSDVHGAEWDQLKKVYDERVEGGRKFMTDKSRKGETKAKGAPAKGAPKFPYQWKTLKARIEQPYLPEEINDYLKELAPEEFKTALKDIYTERTRLFEELKKKKIPYQKAIEEKNKAEENRLIEEAKPIRKQMDKADAVLQLHYRDMALSEKSPKDLKGLVAPSEAQKKEIDESLKPAVNRDAGGKPLKFTDEAGYKIKLNKYLDTKIKEDYESIAKGKGEAEHADKTKIHEPDEIDRIAKAAQVETDAVFGAYAKGPEFKMDKPAVHGKGGKVIKPAVKGNIHDHWQEIQDRLKRMNTGEKKDLAIAVIKYYFRSERDVFTINSELNASPDFDDKNEPKNKEARAQRDVARERVKNPDDLKKLIEIERAWPATAKSKKEGITLQIFRATDKDPNKQKEFIADRHFLWDTFQTVIHEYLHTLTDKGYDKFAEDFGFDSTEYDTLIEGVDSLLTEIAWRNVEPKVKTKELREKVEGPVYAAMDFNADTVPLIYGQRYDTYPQALRLADIVGIKNVYAAYFLGKTDLIGFRKKKGKSAP